MHLPYLEKNRGFSQTRDVFFGLNRNLRPREGEFHDMENLSSDLSPVLSQRRPRGIIKEGGNFLGLGDQGGLCYVEGRDLYLNGKKLSLQLTEEGPKQLISMGAYLIILPDRKYINTAYPGDFGSIDGEYVSSLPVQVSLCTLEGDEITPAFMGSDRPEMAKDHSYWLDFGKKELRQYDQASDLWVLIETPYVKLSCPGIGRDFKPYDGVKLTGGRDLQELAGAAVLYGCSEDNVIFPGLIKEKRTLEEPITLSRKMPVLDFCIEAGNRLWGCRYGPNDQGAVVNEIYCSKLGDFKNWNCFLGISTDSYTVSLGQEGPFTGAISQGGYPIFFREKCLHKVFGQMPSNFQVMTTACRGVEKGCSRSLALVGDTLYYKSPGAVCAYDGSLPRDISEALGPLPAGRAVAGALGDKYYISMERKNAWDLLVYDSEKGLWHREDDLEARFLCGCREDLFCVDSKGRLLSMLGTAGGQEEELSWMAETGIIGVTLPGNKYLSRLSFRMMLDPGSTVTVLVQYDSQGPFQSLGTVQGMRLQSFVFPVVPRRCDHLRLRLEGTGRALLFAVTKKILIGSEA